MTNFEFAIKCKELATNYKTLYVLGGFGAPLNASNKQRAIAQYAYNAKRKAMINAATADTFAFDCCGVIKGLCWDFDGNVNAVYGGAKYASNGIPDIGADAMISYCGNVSKDFSHIEIGEAVWKSGHIGVYIGNGLAVECSPAWQNKVQITACNCTKKGYHTRTWTKHGKLPWILYLPEGDISADGKVTSEDARLALRAAVKLENLTKAQTLAGDLDHDGKITSADARAILNKSVNKD